MAEEEHGGEQADDREADAVGGRELVGDGADVGDVPARREPHCATRGDRTGAHGGAGPVMIGFVARAPLTGRLY